MLFDELKTKPEQDLTVREFVCVTIYEKMKGQKRLDYDIFYLRS